jgi:phosphoglucomutase
LKERFDAIQANEIGYFVTNNGYYLIDDPEVTRAVFADFRSSDSVKRMEIGGLCIKSIRDVTNGTDTALPPGVRSALPATPDAEMITINFENGAVVTVRASGTEPKVKYYSEISSRESADKARLDLQTVVDVIKRDFYKPHKFPMKEQPVM